MAKLGSWFYKTLNNGVLSVVPWENADDLSAVGGALLWDVDFVNQFVHRGNIRTAMQFLCGTPHNAFSFMRPYENGSASTQFISNTSFHGGFVSKMIQMVERIGGRLGHEETEWFGVWAKGDYVYGQDWSHRASNFASVGKEEYDWDVTRPHVAGLYSIWASGAGRIWTAEPFVLLRKIFDATAEYAINMVDTAYYRSYDSYGYYARAWGGSVNAFWGKKSYNSSLTFPLTHAQFMHEGLGTNTPPFRLYPCPAGGGRVSFPGKSVAVLMTQPTIHLREPLKKIKVTVRPLIYAENPWYEPGDENNPITEAGTGADEPPVRRWMYTKKDPVTVLVDALDRPSFVIADGIGRTDTLVVDVGTRLRWHGVVLRIKSIDEEYET